MRETSARIAHAGLSRLKASRFSDRRWIGAGVLCLIGLAIEELKTLAMQLRLRDVVGKSRRELLEIFVTRHVEAAASSTRVDSVAPPFGGAGQRFVR
jgi:hypothetical protein